MDPKVISFQAYRDGRLQSAEGITAPSAGQDLRSNKPLTTQLGLPVDPQLTAMIFPLDDLHGSVFMEKLSQWRPRAVIDFRYFRHFNLPGVGPSIPRAALGDLGAAYIPHEIAAERIDAPVIDAKFLSDACDVAIAVLQERFSGKVAFPIFVLVHKKRHALAMANFVGVTLMQLGDSWTIEPVLGADAIAM